VADPMGGAQGARAPPPPPPLKICNNQDSHVGVGGTGPQVPRDQATNPGGWAGTRPPVGLGPQTPTRRRCYLKKFMAWGGGGHVPPVPPPPLDPPLIEMVRAYGQNLLFHGAQSTVNSVS
jgi:hypothetical protein